MWIRDWVLKISGIRFRQRRDRFWVFVCDWLKKNGIYDKVVGILKANGKNIFEDGGVMPNPSSDKLEEGYDGIVADGYSRA